MLNRPDLTLQDHIHCIKKLDPQSFARLRRACKHTEKLALTYRNIIKVHVAQQDVVIGPITTQATFKKTESKDPKKRFYGLFIFPHDEDYFDIKPDGVCSSHLHWTTSRANVEFKKLIATTAGFIFENLEVRWISTNPWIRYPENEELGEIIDKMQSHFVNVRLSELKVDTIRFLAKKLKPEKLKIHNIDYPIRENMTETFMSEDFKGIKSLVVEGGSPFTCFCNSVSRLAEIYEEFMYIKYQNIQKDRRSENLDRLAAMLLDFVKNWISGAEMKIRSFYLSNIEIPLEIFQTQKVTEYLELLHPNLISLMWVAPARLFNRENTLYHDCVIVPRKNGMGLMVVGFKVTDVFARIVYNEKDFFAALTEFYPATPVDFSLLVEDSQRDKLDQYMKLLKK